MFETALERARLCDALIKEKGPDVFVHQPLLGIPISIKDQIDVQGYDSSMGFSAKISQPAEQHAAIVQVVVDSGAIPFCKTNVPQTLLSFECGNPVFGKTVSPHSKLHTAGGSSGGEAALLGSDGSPMGLGSDIGGSWCA